MSGRYTAIIRWRCRADPAWEIDTRHPEFETAEKAALVANGIGARGLLALRLSQGRIWIEIGSGGRRPFLGEVDTWVKREPSPGVDECRFERVRCQPVDLSARGLDGFFEALRFRILDRTSGSDVPVRFVLDGRRQRLRVVVGTATGADPDADLPRA